MKKLFTRKHPVTMDSMDIDTEILVLSQPKHQIINELAILSKYTNIKCIKTFRRLCYTFIHKYSLSVLITKLLQYTNDYNDYAFDYLGRYPNEASNFIIYFFMEQDYYTDYFNENFILRFINTYPVLVNNTFNAKGQNVLMMFCSSLFSNYKNTHHNFFQILITLLSLNNPLHIDSNKNTILHTIYSHISSQEYQSLINNLTQILIEQKVALNLIVNYQNINNQTALSYSLLTYNSQGIRILINLGAVLSDVETNILLKNAELMQIVDRAMMEKLNNDLNSFNLKK